METDPQLVPSVVSVMVVHEPGDWFEDTLVALAGQDYGNFRTLFLVASDDGHDDEAVTERIYAVIPSAFVRPLDHNPGFGPAANEVLRLVDGDNGFFLICHDDVALAPNAVRMMVAELFRSNAGVVGPKLVDWHEPRRLQHVGLGLDRFGEVDPIVEPGEFDQEQHDAVRDVFVLPSACLLVRADLFRALDGFDDGISFHGDDIDLCWRAHMTGARVVIAPDAVVRHLERLPERRPDLNHRTLRSRHRMRSVAALTSGSRLLGRSVQLVLLTLFELVIGLFTGRFSEAAASLRALVGLIPRTGAIVARRREVRGQRVVPEREILGLQDAGSSRLTSYLRGKETTTYVGADTTVRRWRETSFGPLLAWMVVILGVVIGSRTLIRHGVPDVGQFLPMPQSPAALWQRYASSFDGRGLGATAALPTGVVVLSVLSVLTLFHMGLLLTVSIVGLYLLGALGAWRLSTVFPVNRARIAGMAVYVGTPLVPGALGRGDFSLLVWFAALPWLLHLLRRSAGLEAADPDAAETDLVDGIAAVTPRQRVRSIALLSLTLALAAAFVPVVVVLWAAIGALVALATLLAGGSWRIALWMTGCTAGSVVVAAALNLPWSTQWSWRGLVGAPLGGPTGRSVAEIASLSPTTDRFAVLALALYVPVVASIAITRAWRLTWSVRAGVLIAAFGGLLIASEQGLLSIHLPPSAMLSVPVALGLALGAAAIAGGFGSDVLARGFGWRQPIALLANGAIVIGLIPAVLAVGSGSWHAPNTPMPRLLAAQLPLEPAIGDYRVLYVGDPRLLPVPAHNLVDGISYAVTDAGPLEFTDWLLGPRTTGDDAVERALRLIAGGSTLRAGRLLAPLGVRYVIIPKTDAVVSTVDDPLPVADGLVASFENQLDIGSIYGPPSLEIYVNQAWFPVGAQLTGADADTSRLAGEDALTRTDVAGAAPALVGADAGAPGGGGQFAPGVVHLAIPFDPRITLDVDGVDVPGRPGFGVTTAFDLPAGGNATLGYRQDGTRRWWLVGQALAWLAVIVVAAGARSPFGRRRTTDLHDETLIDLDEHDLDLDAAIESGIVGEALAGRPAVDADEPAVWDDDWGFDRSPLVDAADLPRDEVVRRSERVPTRAEIVAQRDDAPVRPPLVADDDDEVDLAALVAGLDERSGTVGAPADDDDEGDRS